MSREHYATTYMTDSYCAAFRHGVLIIVRLKDGHSAILDVRQTNVFRYNVEMMRAPINAECELYKTKFRKAKYITATLNGAIITIHKQHIPQERNHAEG